jgi:hypothetical protein
MCVSTRTHASRQTERPHTERGKREREEGERQRHGYMQRQNRNTGKEPRCLEKGMGMPSPTITSSSPGATTSSHLAYRVFPSTPFTRNSKPVNAWEQSMAKREASKGKETEREATIR